MTASTPRAVLWDLDGTLVDTAEQHLLAWRSVLEPLGIEVTPERFLRTFGRRNDAVLRDLVGERLAGAEIARLGGTKEGLYRDLVRAGEVVALPGVRAWLGRLRGAGWRQALASSAPHANIAAILDGLGLEDAFEAIVGEEDVERGKPDPQTFLAAAAKLGVAPIRAIVVEDAPAGVEAARRAGMRSIGVGTLHGLLAADLAVPSLADLPDDAFDRLLGG